MTDKTFEETVKEEFPEATVKELQIIEGEYKTIEPLNLKSLGEVYKLMNSFVKQEMHEDLDFGTIPGTGKPSLYKPGAEKLQRLFGFSTSTELVDKEEDWKGSFSETEFPLFHYRYVTKVWDRNEKLLATCEGEANSYETRYRWRWVSEYEVPEKYDKKLLKKQIRTESEFAFAIENAETGGQYGKPVEYWESWKKDIKDGNAHETKRKTSKGKMLDAWERGGTMYRIANEDIHSQINTLIKISQKRSYVGAVIIAANASEYFTQDLEDHAENIKEEFSVRMYVPSKQDAAQILVKHARSLGVESPDKYIKEILDTNNLNFSLDKWTEIIDLIEEFKDNE